MVLSLLRLRRYRYTVSDFSTVYTIITTSGSVLFTRSPTFVLIYINGRGGLRDRRTLLIIFIQITILWIRYPVVLYLRQCHHQPAHARDRHCIVARRLYRVPAVAALCRPPTLPYPCLGLPLSPAGRRSTREPLTPTLWSHLIRPSPTNWISQRYPYVSDRKWCAGFAFCRYCCFHSSTIDVTVCSLKYKNLDSNSSMKLRQAK